MNRIAIKKSERRNFLFIYFILYREVAGVGPKLLELRNLRDFNGQSDLSFQRGRENGVDIRMIAGKHPSIREGDRHLWRTPIFFRFLDCLSREGDQTEPLARILGAGNFAAFTVYQRIGPVAGQSP